MLLNIRLPLNPWVMDLKGLNVKLGIDKNYGI